MKTSNNDRRVKKQFSDDQSFDFTNFFMKINVNDKYYLQALSKIVSVIETKVFYAVFI